MLSSNLFRALSIFATVTLGLAACGDDGGSGGAGGGSGGAGGSPDVSATTAAGGTQNTGGAGQGGGQTGVWAKYCEDKAARAEECGQEPETPEQIEECKSKASCWETGFQPAYIEKYAECGSRPCDQSDDACAAAAAEATPTTDATSAAIAKCAANECAELDKDICAFAKVASDAVAAEISTCLDKTCAEVNDCFGSVVAGIFEPCGGK